MRNLVLIFLSVLVLSAGPVFQMADSTHQKKVLSYPANWPAIVYDFKKNPMSAAGFELGRALFYDPILSNDSSISCSSCHLSFTGFAHTDHTLSHGIEGQIGKRNAPALMNLIWSPVFHWDGGVLHLEQQAINPISQPDEMGSSLPEVLKKLNRRPDYRKMFFRAFGDSLIRTDHFLKGLAQFTSSLISYRSRYDQFMAGDSNARFTEKEKNGLLLFRKKCSSCHPEPLFTNYSFQNNLLKPDSVQPDSGRFLISRKKNDIFRFKVPGLRNIAQTFPYMHDGRFRNLKQVLSHYEAIGQAETGHWSENSPYGDKEKKDILAFLLTLTDTSFLRNRQFQHPGFQKQP